MFNFALYKILNPRREYDQEPALRLIEPLEKEPNDTVYAAEMKLDQQSVILMSPARDMEKFSEKSGFGNSALSKVLDKVDKLRQKETNQTFIINLAQCTEIVGRPPRLHWTILVIQQNKCYFADPKSGLGATAYRQLIDPLENTLQQKNISLLARSYLPWQDANILFGNNDDTNCGRYCAAITGVVAQAVFSNKGGSLEALKKILEATERPELEELIYESKLKIALRNPIVAASAAIMKQYGMEAQALSPSLPKKNEEKADVLKALREAMLSGEYLNPQHYGLSSSSHRGSSDEEEKIAATPASSNAVALTSVKESPQSVMEENDSQHFEEVHKHHADHWRGSDPIEADIDQVPGEQALGVEERLKLTQAQAEKLQFKHKEMEKKYQTQLTVAVVKAQKLRQQHLTIGYKQRASEEKKLIIQQLTEGAEEARKQAVEQSAINGQTSQLLAQKEHKINELKQQLQIHATHQPNLTPNEAGETKAKANQFSRLTIERDSAQAENRSLKKELASTQNSSKRRAQWLKYSLAIGLFALGGILFSFATLAYSISSFFGVVALAETMVIVLKLVGIGVLASGAMVGVKAYKSADDIQPSNGASPPSSPSLSFSSNRDRGASSLDSVYCSPPLVQVSVASNPASMYQPASALRSESASVTPGPQAPQTEIINGGLGAIKP